jgi:plastocyanin
VQLRRGALAAAAAVAAVAVAVAPASGAPAGDPAHARKTAKVTVADDYYAPTAVKIKQDDKVKWAWAGDNLDTHNVVLGKRHPNGVKKGDFSSSSGAINLSFTRKFKKPGTYDFLCTYHRGVMRMTVKVKR